jgi:uncharacterized RDD family membrane protein YckC
MSDIRTAGEAVPAPQAEIAGFWRRLFAFFLDLLILAVVGFAIISTDFDRIAALGSEGRLIGFPISLAYFGILNSRYGGGASIAKRLLGLRVVDRSGEHIGLLRALLRTVVLTLPYYLNGFFIPGDPLGAQALPVDFVTSFIVFGCGGAIIYLYIFNRGTRQSLHDLVAGTFVVRAKDQRAPVAVHIWRGHVVAAAVLLLASLAVVPALFIWLPGSLLGQSLTPLDALIMKVEQDPDVLSAQASEDTSVFAMSGAPSQTTTYLSVKLQVRRRLEPEPIADRAAAKVLAMYPDLLGRQYLSITVTISADTGLWRENFGNRYVYTREQWLQRLHPATAAKPV